MRRLPEGVVPASVCRNPRGTGSSEVLLFDDRYESSTIERACSPSKSTGGCGVHASALLQYSSIHRSRLVPVPWVLGILLIPVYWKYDGQCHGSQFETARPTVAVAWPSLLDLTVGKAREGEGVLMVMHGRSRMTIEPRIPTMPGWSTSGFHRPGRHSSGQARSAVRCLASRVKGELRPAIYRLWGGLRHLVRTFLRRTCFVFRCGHFQRQRWVY